MDKKKKILTTPVKALKQFIEELGAESRAGYRLVDMLEEDYDSSDLHEESDENKKG